MPPPLEPAFRLPDIVLLIIVRLATAVPLPAPLLIPAPKPLAWLPETVLLLSVTDTDPLMVTLLVIPAPFGATLLETLELFSVNVPVLKTPPADWLALLPVTTQSVRVRVPLFRNPAPEFSPGPPCKRPFVIVKPDILTVR